MTIKRKLQYQVRTIKGYLLGVGDTPEEAIYNASHDGILKRCNLCESYIEEVFIDGELVKMNEHIQKIKRIKVRIDLSSIVYCYDDKEVVI